MYREEGGGVRVQANSGLGDTDVEGVGRSLNAMQPCVWWPVDCSYTLRVSNVMLLNTARCTSDV